jgi:hypothetical protein
MAVFSEMKLLGQEHEQLLSPKFSAFYQSNPTSSEVLQMQAGTTFSIFALQPLQTTWQHFNLLVHWRRT